MYVGVGVQRVQIRPLRISLEEDCLIFSPESPLLKRYKHLQLCSNVRFAPYPPVRLTLGCSRLSDAQPFSA